MKVLGLCFGLALWLAAFACGGLPHADRTGGQNPAPLGDEYRIQSEDVLRILVYNETQVNVDVPVGKDGNIVAPFVGAVHVAGKTTDEVEAILVGLYKAKVRIREPLVSVIIMQYRQLKASVGGEVIRPDKYVFRPGDTIASLLTMGGGPIPDMADLHHATLRHANSSELIPIDLYALLDRADTSQNYVLQDGDELNVPEDSNMKIAVQGAVQQPGPFPYKDDMRLADAISLAKGEVPGKSMLSKVLIIRPILGQPGQFYRIEANYVKFIQSGDVAENITLKPGDLIYVPTTRTPDLTEISGLIQTVFYSVELLNSGIIKLRL